LRKQFFPMLLGYFTEQTELQTQKYCPCVRAIECVLTRSFANYGIVSE
jgi:predicted nucleotide-binding protein (sugar kinase/HSP70/actin superfamily)